MLLNTDVFCNSSECFKELKVGIENMEISHTINKYHLRKIFRMHLYSKILTKDP